MLRKLMLCLIVSIFLISTISAYEWDNVKDYDPITKEVTISNSILFIPTSTIAKIRLDTPINNVVGLGYQKVAEFTIVNYGDYTDALRTMQFYNLKDSSKSISRTYDYKYKEYYNLSVNDYKQICREDTWSKNSTKFTNCTNEIVGHHNVLRYNWLELTGELKEGTYTIGIFTDVQQGDYVEWIPTYYGVKIDEWATWTADLNTGLIMAYDLNEGDTTGTGTIIDAMNFQNGTNIGAYNTSGKIGSSYQFQDGESDRINLTTNAYLGGEDGMSVSVWIRPFDVSPVSVTYVGKGNDFILGRVEGVHGGDGVNIYDGASWHFASGGVGFVNNTWNHLVATYNNTHLRLYMNGTSFANTSWVSTNPDTKADWWYLASGSWGSYKFDGSIDMAYFWNRSLTDAEVVTIYNAGVGMEYDASPSTNTSVILNSPDDNDITSNTLIVFNATANASTGNTIKNMSLWTNETGVWASRNITTGLSGTTSTNTWTRRISKQNILWNVQSCDSTNTCAFADSNYTLITNNTIIITPNSPANLSIVLSGNTNFNATVISAMNLQNVSLWINNSLYQTNSSGINGVNYIFTKTLSSDIYSWRVEACDDNNVCTNSSSRNLIVESFVENSQSYTSPVGEGSTEIFTANVSIGGGYSLSSAILTYNNVNYTGSISGTTYKTLSRTLTIPTVTSDTNYTFNWTITLNNSKSYKLTTYNQTIINSGADNCTAYSTTVFNFTLVDEDSQIAVNNSDENITTSIKVDVNFTSTSGSVVASYSKWFNDTLPARICYNGALPVRVDAIVEYSATNKFTEFYYIQNFNLSSTSKHQNITLYDLNSSKGYEFKITYKNANFNTVPGAIVQIQRKYVDEGTFKTVEQPKISSAGYAVAHLVRNDAIYNMIILQDGTVIATFSDITAYCYNPTFTDCVININSYSDAVEQYNWTTIKDFAVSLSFNKTTRVITGTFTIPSGTSQVVKMNVTQMDGYGTTQVCTQTITSSGGSLTCTVPASFGNSTVVVQFWADGVLKTTSYLSLAKAPSELYGNNLVFLGLMIIVFTVGIAISSDPKMSLLILVVGFIACMGLNILTTRSWIGTGATILWLVIGVIIIMIKGENR